MPQVILSLGSNIEPEKNLDAAIKTLSASSAINIIRISSIYVTEPWGYAQQEDFLNCAIYLQTTFAPSELLAFAQSIEKAQQRVRSIKNGPRTLDIDILLYDQMISDDPLFTLPHPGLLKRDFMLLPSIEVYPEYLHPVSQKPISGCQDSLEFFVIRDKLSLRGTK